MITPTITHIFATNDIPKFQTRTKGSEEDRSLVLYLPNRVRTAGQTPTSPRTFDKDLSLEEEVATDNFALGLLVNLIQVRKALNSNLGSAIAAGTPTSNWWRAKWVEQWTADGQPIAPQPLHSKLHELHQRLYNDGKFSILECWV